MASKNKKKTTRKPPSKDTVTKQLAQIPTGEEGNLVVGDETGFGPAGKYVWVEKVDGIVEYVYSTGRFDVGIDLRVVDFTPNHVSLHEQKLVKKGAECVLMTGFFDREDGRRVWESALYFKKPKRKHVLPRRD